MSSTCKSFTELDFILSVIIKNGYHEDVLFECIKMNIRNFSRVKRFLYLRAQLISNFLGWTTSVVDRPIKLYKLWHVVFLPQEKGFSI